MICAEKKEAQEERRSILLLKHSCPACMAMQHCNQLRNDLEGASIKDFINPFD